MPIPRSLLMVELLMSADRVITAAQDCTVHPRSGEWPAAVVVGHLSLVDTAVWLPRIDVMVAAMGADVPELSWWEPDPVATLAAFGDVSVDEAGARLLSSRTTLLHRLRDLSEDEWSATAHHDIFGTLDVEGLMLQVLGHDEEHRASILLSTDTDPRQA